MVDALFKVSLSEADCKALPVLKTLTKIFSHAKADPHWQLATPDPTID